MTKDASLRRDEGLISLWLPRRCSSITRLRFALPFHFAAPPTPEQADSAFSKPLGFSSGRAQNPPVLLPLERLCSAREHPLSSVSGRQRYNTLDFADKVVCHETAGFIGFFLPRRVLPSIGCLPPRQRCRLWKPLPRERCPLWIPQPTGCSPPLLETPRQRNCHPFGIPARFEMSTHK